MGKALATRARYQRLSWEYRALHISPAAGTSSNIGVWTGRLLRSSIIRSNSKTLAGRSPSGEAAQCCMYTWVTTITEGLVSWPSASKPVSQCRAITDGLVSWSSVSQSVRAEPSHRGWSVGHLSASQSVHSHHTGAGQLVICQPVSQSVHSHGDSRQTQGADVA